MSKYTGPKLKLARREKYDLNLKSGIKDISLKCKLNQSPGQIHIRKSRISDYCVQLREKQKLKRIYGITEKQFYNYYKKSLKTKNENTGYMLLRFLETRLDNIVYRIGFGITRAESRQLINHKLIKINNKIVNIPSYIVKVNDEISLLKKMVNNVKINLSIKNLNKKENISWIEFDKKKFIGKLLYIPKRNEFLKDINENLIIEIYSK